jgi:hypothetical protein
MCAILTPPWPDVCHVDNPPSPLLPMCATLPPPLPHVCLVVLLQALTDQAILAVDSAEASVLPVSNQRRLARILDEVDPNAVQKLLLWEAVYKEEAEGDDTRKANRLRKLVQAKIKALDKQAVRAQHRGWDAGRVGAIGRSGADTRSMSRTMCLARCSSWLCAGCTAAPAPHITACNL